MPPIWKPQSRQVYQKWIDDVYNQGMQLNEFERRYLTSMENKLHDHDLTEAEAETLEVIYVNKTR